MYDLCYKFSKEYNNRLFYWKVSTQIKDIELKLIYSEKATKICEISTLLLSYVVPVKSKVEISQNFVAISEYWNFKDQDLLQ